MSALTFRIVVAGHGGVLLHFAYASNIHSKALGRFLPKRYLSRDFLGDTSQKHLEELIWQIFHDISISHNYCLTIFGWYLLKLFLKKLVVSIFRKHIPQGFFPRPPKSVLDLLRLFKTIGKQAKWLLNARLPNEFCSHESRHICWTTLRVFPRHVVSIILKGFYRKESNRVSFQCIVRFSCATYCLNFFANLCGYTIDYDSLQFSVIRLISQIHDMRCLRSPMTLRTVRAFLVLEGCDAGHESIQEFEIMAISGKGNRY